MPSVSVSFQSFGFAGHMFRPLPCGALYWPAEALLLVADLHLEKGSSLARDGWLLPPYDSIETLERLTRARAETGAPRIALLGDSFHDRDGPGRLPPRARELLHDLAAAAGLLWIGGNHDAGAAGPGGQMLDRLLIGPILLLHEVVPGVPGAQVGGHFHPKVRVALRTGRRVSRRCFALGAERLILPAYGAYAGGLDIDDPALVAATGPDAEAVVPLSLGLVRLPSATRRTMLPARLQARAA